LGRRIRSWSKERLARSLRAPSRTWGMGQVDRSAPPGASGMCRGSRRPRQARHDPPRWRMLLPSRSGRGHGRTSSGTPRSRIRRCCGRAPSAMASSDRPSCHRRDPSACAGDPARPVRSHEVHEGGFAEEASFRPGRRALARRYTEALERGWSDLLTPCTDCTCAATLGLPETTTGRWLVAALRDDAAGGAPERRGGAVPRGLQVPCCCDASVLRRDILSGAPCS
jgi:hypothetical protein